MKLLDWRNDVSKKKFKHSGGRLVKVYDQDWEIGSEYTYTYNYPYHAVANKKVLFVYGVGDINFMHNVADRKDHVYTKDDKFSYTKIDDVVILSDGDKKVGGVVFEVKNNMFDLVKFVKESVGFSVVEIELEGKVDKAWTWRL